MCILVTRRCTHFSWMGWIYQCVGCSSTSTINAQSANQSSKCHLRQGKSILNGSTGRLVSCISWKFHRSSVLIATNTLQVASYDIRQFDRPSQVFDTNLNYSLRCVRTLRGGEGFATSCIEGRVSLSYFAPNDKVNKGRRNDV